MRSFLQHPLLRALAAVAAIILLGCWFNADGAFFQFNTHRDMLRSISTYGILACGMTLVILTGGIDLAVGSILGFTSVLFSMMLIYWRWPPAVAIPACLAAGLILGSASGGLVAGFKMQPFIATLAMMVFARGMAKVVSGGEKVSTYSAKAALPDGAYPEPPAIFASIDSRLFADNIAVVTVIFLACVALCWFLLGRTVAGRHLYAVGGNELAARYSGVRVGWVKFAAYALSGFFAALAGLCQAAQEQQGDPEAGQTYELTAIAIVVIGGTSLLGGRGGILLTLVGTLTIGYLEKILSINAVGEASRLMLTGVIIVGAVLMQRSRRNA